MWIPECVVFSVLALSLVDCDSPADMFCVVSSCSVAGCWPVFSPSFSSSFLSPSCVVSSLGSSTFSLGLFTVGSQVVDNNFASANICAIAMGGSALLGQTSEVAHASTAASHVQLLQFSAFPLQECEPIYSSFPSLYCVSFTNHNTTQIIKCC